MKPVIYCFLAVGLLLSCKQKQPGAVAIVDIYNRDSVEWLLHNGLANRVAAERDFKAAETKLRTDKQAGEAMQLFVRSVAAYPSARAYFELGNAAVEAGIYKTAIDAYQMAEALDYKPYGQLMYNIAYAYSRSDEGWKAGEYLEFAIEAGFKTDATKARLNKEDFSYDDWYEGAMAGVDDAVEVLWKGFRASFSAIALPVVIDNKFDKSLMGSKSLPYRYGRFVSEMQTRNKFSRGGGDIVFPVGSVAETDNYVVYIYANIGDYEMGDDIPACYWMVSYTKAGEQIDKMHIAGANGLVTTSRVISINKDLTFQVKEFKNTYTRNPEKEGFAGNAITASDLVSTKEYKISDEGKFTEEAPRMGMR